MQGDWYTEAEVPILWPPDANGQGTRSCVPQLRPSTAKRISSCVFVCFFKEKRETHVHHLVQILYKLPALFHPLFNTISGLSPFSLIPMCSDLSCSSIPLLPGFTLHGFIIQIAKVKNADSITRWSCFLRPWVSKGIGVPVRWTTGVFPPLVFSVPLYPTWHAPAALHVALEFQDTILPHDLAPRHKPNILSVAQL